MGETVLVTLGRLPKGLEIARALAGAGCRVIVADPFAWHLTRLSRAVERSVRVAAPALDARAFRRDLLEVIEREQVARVCPVSEEIFHVAGVERDLPAEVRLHCMTQSTLLELHDKLAFVRRAQALDLPVPETYAADSDAGRSFAAAHAFVVKPMRASSGNGLSLHGAGEAIPETMQPSVLQALLPGQETATFSVAHEGRVLGTVVYRARILSGTVAVSFERVIEPDPEQLHWIERFAAGTAFSGFLSFDFRVDEQGRNLPIECNPRATSGIHFVAPGALAKSILAPASCEEFALRPEVRLQQFFPALTAVQSAALRGAPRPAVRTLFECRDVAWQASDPLPFVLMTPASGPILSKTIFKGMSFGDAATADVGFYD